MPRSRTAPLHPNPGCLNFATVRNSLRIEGHTITAARAFGSTNKILDIALSTPSWLLDQVGTASFYGRA